MHGLFGGLFGGMFGALFGGDAPAVPIIANPSATFTPVVEAGAKLHLEWLTDVLKMWSGKEQRVSLLANPRQRLELSTLFDDSSYRALLGTLVATGAAASPFLVALAHEDITVVSCSGTTINVHSLTYVDWAVTGQRAAIVSPGGDRLDAVVQEVLSATSIRVDVNASAVALPGARIMPVIPVYLEPEQALSRHRVRYGRWDMTARAAEFGYGATTTFGAGASLTTAYGYKVWDKGNVTALASQPLLSGAQLQDLGARLGQIANYEHPDWTRQIRIESSRIEDWQWLKLMLGTLRGRHLSFLLPTGRPDLEPVGDASSGTLVVDDDADYADSWFASLAHRRLKLVTTAGVVGYREVESCLDNGDGTQSLTLDSSFAGALARVELLETVRLERDDAMVEFRGPAWSCGLTARVVQA